MADIPSGSCPHCGIINNEGVPITGPDVTEPGTIMICETCARVSIYIGHGATRKPEPEELAALMEDPTVVQAVLEAEVALL